MWRGRRPFRLTRLRKKHASELGARSAGELTLVVADSALHGLGVLAGVSAVVYLAATAYGAASGFALPNTAVFSLLPAARSLAGHERAFPYVVLTVGWLGSVIGWLSSLSPVLLDRQRRRQRATMSLLRWSAPVVVLAAYLFSVAGPWAGVYRPGDYVDVALGGLVPFSDARGHFEGPLWQIMTGRFDSWVERRLVAAAMRSTIALFVSYSATAFLLLQVAGLALATSVSALAVARWRGPWAGVTYFGLVYVQIRPYLATYLTEPLGFFWALVAVPFFIGAIRTRSLAAGAMSLLATCLSLLTRMGSMLTIPALALWVCWTGWRSGERLLRVCSAVALVIALCGGLNLALWALYGSGAGAPGANFSHVLCGLAHGGTWDVCERGYAPELAAAGTEAGRARVRLAKAREMILRQPGLLLGRLAEGEAQFSRNLFDRAVLGFFGLPAPAHYPVRGWQLMAAAGLLWVLLRRRERNELSFWLAMGAGLFASAPWVIFDDGWRVLSGSFPLVALFLAGGFCTPATQPVDEPHGLRRAAPPAALCVLLLLVAAPHFARQLDLIRGRALIGLPVRPGEAWVLGGRRVAGLLVVPDGTTLPVSIPAQHFSDFERAVHASNVESYEKLLYPELRRKEFGVVATVGSTRGVVFVTPPELMRRPEVNAWRLSIEGRDPRPEADRQPTGPHPAERRRSTPGRYFLFADQATPVVSPTR